MKLVLTCEHAANEIPGDFKDLFQNARGVLETHRGYDPGALHLFEQLVPLAFFSFAYRESRLLIEPNRSLHHPNLFSEYTVGLPKEQKNVLINNYYLPYRNNVESAISNIIDQGEKVLHFSVHSFTPVFNNHERITDIGLLYDPSKKAEKEFCTLFGSKLKSSFPEYRLRYNYPYLGKADGFTTYLRKIFPSQYLGIELEINQEFTIHNKVTPALRNAVYKVLKTMF